MLAIVVILPVVEEILFRLILVWWLMTLTFHWPAPKTVLYSAVIFTICHLPVVIRTLDPLRFLDALIIGVFNGIACVVYLRLWGLGRSQEGVLVAYLCLVVIHAAYNLATLIPGLRGLARIAGAVLALGAWIAYMPSLG